MAAEPTEGGSFRIAMIVADAGIPIMGNKGASVHVRAMATALASLGHEPVIFAARRGRDEQRDFRVPVIEPAPGPDERGITGHAMVHDERPPQLAEIERLLASRAIEAELLAAHSSRPFDAIYERLSLWSYAGIAASRSLGIPVLLEANARLVGEQEKYRSLTLSALARAIERHVLGAADAVLAVSAPLVEELVDAGARAERTLVLPNGADTNMFRPSLDGRAQRACWGIAADEVVVGFAGSLKPWHGVDHLIAALERLPHLKLRLVVVGDGPERARCQRLASVLPAPAMFTGAIPHDEVPAAVAAFDIAIAPLSATAGRYFSPLKAFEYAAAGRAVIAAADGQIEALFPAGSVLLYPPGDHEQLARRIADLANDPCGRRRLGTKAAEFVFRHHSWRHNAASVAALIGRLREEEAAA